MMHVRGSSCRHSSISGVDMWTRRVCRLSADFDDAHHSFVFVVEDVAVVDGASGKVVKEDPHCDVAVGGHVDDVLPGWLFDQLLVPR